MKITKTYPGSCPGCGGRMDFADISGTYLRYECSICESVLWVDSETLIPVIDSLWPKDKSDAN